MFFAITLALTVLTAIVGQGAAAPHSITRRTQPAWVVPLGEANLGDSRAVARFPALAVRGGAKDDDKDDDREWKFEEVMPAVSALPAAVLGIDMLLNPDGCARYLEDDRDATDSERTCGMFLGVQQLVSAAAVAGLAWQGGLENAKLANAIVLGNVLASEAVMQYQVARKEDKPGFVALQQGWRMTFSALRACIAIGAAAALWKCYKDEDED